MSFTCDSGGRVMWFGGRELASDPWRCQADTSQTIGDFGDHPDANRWITMVSFPVWRSQPLPWSFPQANLWGPCVFQSQENTLRLDLFAQLQAGGAWLKVRVPAPLLLIQIKTFWWVTRKFLNNQTSIQKAVNFSAFKKSTSFQKDTNLHLTADDKRTGHLHFRRVHGLTDLSPCSRW